MSVHVRGRVHLCCRACVLCGREDECEQTEIELGKKIQLQLF